MDVIVGHVEGSSRCYLFHELSKRLSTRGWSVRLVSESVVGLWCPNRLRT